MLYYGAAHRSRGFTLRLDALVIMQEFSGFLPFSLLHGPRALEHSASDEALTLYKPFISALMQLAIHSGRGELDLSSPVPAPEKVNAARRSRRKEPFYEYHVLKLRPPEECITRAEPHAEGERSGVRLHMRRGHPRKLRSGKIVWVRHTMVGDKAKGLVMKDYDCT